MDFVSVRVITHDVGRLATFWEQVTGLPATRPVPVFAELKTPAGTIAIGAPATVAMLGAAAPVPGQNRSVFIDLIGDIGRRVLDNLLADRRLRVSPRVVKRDLQIPGQRPQH